MEQRHYDERRVVGRERVGVLDVFNGLHQVKMSEGNALGTACGARSVEKQRDVGIGGDVSINL